MIKHPRVWKERLPENPFFTLALRRHCRHPSLAQLILYSVWAAITAIFCISEFGNRTGSTMVGSVMATLGAHTVLSMHLTATGERLSRRLEQNIDDLLLPYSPPAWLARRMMVTAYVSGIIWLLGLPFIILLALRQSTSPDVALPAYIAVLAAAFSTLPSHFIWPNSVAHQCTKSAIPLRLRFSAILARWYALLLPGAILIHEHFRTHFPLLVAHPELPLWPLWFVTFLAALPSAIAGRRFMCCVDAGLLYEVRRHFQATLLACHALLLLVAHSLLAPWLPGWTWIALAGSVPLGLILLEAINRRNAGSARYTRPAPRKQRWLTPWLRRWANPMYRFHLRRVWDDQTLQRTWCVQGVLMLLGWMLSRRYGLPIEHLWLRASSTACVLLSLLPAPVRAQWLGDLTGLWIEDARQVSPLEQIMLTPLSSRDLLLGRFVAAVLATAVRSLPLLLGGTVLLAMADLRYVGLVWGMFVPAFGTLTFLSGCTVPNRSPEPSIKEKGWRNSKVLLTLCHLAVIVSFGLWFWGLYARGSALQWTLLFLLHWMAGTILAEYWLRLQARTFDELRAGIRPIYSPPE